MKAAGTDWGFPQNSKKHLRAYYVKTSTLPVPLPLIPYFPCSWTIFTSRSVFFQVRLGFLMLDNQLHLFWKGSKHKEMLLTNVVCCLTLSKQGSKVPWGIPKRQSLKRLYCRIHLQFKEKIIKKIKPWVWSPSHVTRQMFAPLLKGEPQIL